MRYGFIGCGNMGSAIARAVCRGAGAENVTLANRTPAKAEALAKELGCAAADNNTVAADCDVIFLGVKPQMMAGMLAGIAPVLAKRGGKFLLVSMAAGLSMARVREMAGGEYPIIRIMPNTPAAIGQGMILYAPSENVTAAALETFLDSMSGAGRFARLEERLIDAGSAVSGCGPAFVDLFIEALADGGVACGLPRSAAMELAAQMVLGSAALVLSDGRHPGALKDAVCSPGGTTIQGVRALEKGGFRSTVMEAVIVAYEKNFDLK